MTNLKKYIVAVEIVQMWGNCITEEGPITVVETDNRVREVAIA